MLYVIDTENFNGCIVAKMENDKYIDGTALKLETYKAKKGLPGLKAVTVEEFEKIRGEYIESRQTNFQEINEDEFYIRINELVVKRHFLSKELKFFYLATDESVFGIYPLYAYYKNKYYTAQKDINLSLDSILSYIKTRKELTILSMDDAGQHTGLFNYMQEHGISEITELFDAAGPDKVRLNAEDILFVQVDTGKDRYIIHLDCNTEDKPILRLILKRFYCDNFLSFFEKKPSLWSEYKDKCIAYRDGSGSTYTIWQYKY